MNWPSAAGNLLRPAMVRTLILPVEATRDRDLYGKHPIETWGKLLPPDYFLATMAVVQLIEEPVVSDNSSYFRVTAEFIEIMRANFVAGLLDRIEPELVSYAGTAPGKMWWQSPAGDGITIILVSKQTR